MQTTQSFAYPGAALSISSNGKKHGILWAVEISTAATHPPAILHAYDAMDLHRELYRSDSPGGRDQLDTGVKFASPVVAGGKVYVSGQSSVTVLGLFKQNFWSWIRSTFDFR